MQGIGAVLRREREKRNLTLDDIAEKTKIRTKYLDAIENEKFEVLPGAVYVKGFISSYIKCLGIGNLPEVQEIMQAKEESLLPEEENVEPRGPIKAWEEEEVHGHPMRKGKPQSIEEEPLNKKRSVIVLLSVLAICALLLVQWLFNGGLQREQVEVPEEPNVVEQLPEENTLPEEIVASPEPVYEGLVMELTIIDLTAGAQDKCWLEIKTDGTQALNSTLIEGQTAKIEAKESIKLHLGNAGVVSITLNGKSLGTLGTKGEVVTREFTLSDVAE